MIRGRESASCGSAIWDRISKKKIIESHDTTTVLNRYLTTAHLTFMGVGATVGVGIYVLVGEAAKDTAGPSLLISFILAGLLTMINAVIFAEFGARIPTTGASYTYVYESLCEGMAFIVGWLILLGYLTSGAVGCRAWSGYFDSLFDGAVHNLTIDTFGTIDVGPPLSDHLDIVASLLEIVAMIIVALGIHASSTVNAVLSMISVGVLLFVTVMGIAFGDISNVVNHDHGGFFPFGFKGVVVATSACFYAFNGYDVICMSAEESKTPAKSVPRAILFELILVTLLYAGSSFALMMLTPYYLIDIRAPIPSAFEIRGIMWAKYVVTIGPVLGIGNLSLLNLYAASRHIYCMSNDGLLLTFCGRVNLKSKVPFTAIILSGSLIAISTLIFDLSKLVQFNVLAMFSINTILSVGVLVLRSHDNTSSHLSEKKCPQEKRQGWLYRIRTEYILLSIVILSTVFSSLIIWRPVFDPDIPALVMCILCLVLITALTVILKIKLKPSSFTGFQVPFVPFVPVMCILLNIFFLLYSSDANGLITFLILVVLGYIIYFSIIICTKPKYTEKTSRHLHEENIELLLEEEVIDTA